MTEPEQEEGALIRGAWLPEVHEALMDLIDRRGNHADGYDPARPPIVAIDLDGTLIFNDLGEAMLRYMVTRRRLNTDRGFWHTIPDGMGRDAIMAAYKAVAGRADSEVRDTAAYRRYRSGLLGVHEHLRVNEGDEAAATFACRVLRGQHERTVAELVEEVVDYELGRQLGHEDIMGGPPFAGLVVPTGIRVYREMLNLLHVLKTYGFETYLISSTNVYVARALSRWLRGEDDEPLVPEERVLGAELVSQSGVYTDRVLDGMPVGEAKLDLLLDNAGRSPVLAMGDSMDDFEMLENCEDVVVVMDSGREDVAEKAADMEWLLQPQLSI